MNNLARELHCALRHLSLLLLLLLLSMFSYQLKMTENTATKRNKQNPTGDAVLWGKGGGVGWGGGGG